MKKLKLSQAEIDKLVVVERRTVEPSVLGVGIMTLCFNPRLKARLSGNTSFGRV